MMRNEVEKMYENCNIKPKQKGYCNWDSNCPYPHHKCNDECPYWKYEDIAKYPPFTAEKQLELIKRVCPSYPLNYHIKCFKGYTFEDGLAKCINNLWQYLTVTKQREIRKILKGTNYA